MSDFSLKRKEILMSFAHSPLKGAEKASPFYEHINLLYSLYIVAVSVSILSPTIEPLRLMTANPFCLKNMTNTIK